MFFMLLALWRQMNSLGMHQIRKDNSMIVQCRVA